MFAVSKRNNNTKNNKFMALYKNFREIAETKTRDFLIEKMDGENYMTKEMCFRLPKKSINGHWANMMQDKIKTALNIKQ